MSKLLDVLLLLALPASGKSEVRRFLASATPEKRRDAFHLGDAVELDDFPYVHLMRRIDQELVKLGQVGLYFESDDQPMKDPRDWGTLIALLNEDFDDLTKAKRHAPESAAAWLFERFDNARAKVGVPAAIAMLPGEMRDKLAAALDREAADLLANKNAGVPSSLDGKTVVIEFARGGPDGSPMPLAAPYGYAHSLSVLSPAILSKATILYVWVTPEESRRKNEARTDPNDPGSILHHGVPIAVMLGDYGCDDIDSLLSASGKPDCVKIDAHGKSFVVPLARFDNRDDKTTFVRGEPDAWAASDVEALGGGLSEAFGKLVAAR